MKRRDFLSTSIGAGAAPAFLGAQNKTKYRTALIGSGWWGMNILREAVKSRECAVVAMCDVDANQLNPAAAEIEKMSGDTPRQYKDYRELLAAEDIEIAIVGTPDHWHALTTIAAVGKGAHVYVEKPICHTVMEGRAMVNAARAAGRTVQVGTHRRVSPHNKSAMQFLMSGGAGDIGMVRCFVHSTGSAGTKTPDTAPPPGLDWGLWCGPAPLNPFNKTIHPKGFRNHLDYANGTLGDWGIHWLDQLLWWTEEKWPKRVSSYGGRWIKKDSTDAPDTQVVIYDFESFTCTWEHRRYAGNNSEKHRLGMYFYGTKGILHLGWLDGWTFYPANRENPTMHQDPVLRQPDSQNIPELFADFLSAIKEKRRPACNIEIGHRSTNCALLGMLSWKLGRSIEWDGVREICLGDSEATKGLRREYRGPWEYPKA